MPIQDTLKIIQSKCHNMIQLLSDIRSLAAKTQHYITAAESGDITVTAEQKAALMTKYNALKAKLEAIYRELP